MDDALRITTGKLPRIDRPPNGVDAAGRHVRSRQRSAASDTLSALNAALGGEIGALGTRLERLTDSDEDRAVFDVLAIDLAMTTTEFNEFDKPRLVGHQECRCRAPHPDPDNNWYRCALNRYFDLPPKTSLLSYPVGVLSSNQWWVARPPIGDLNYNDAENSVPATAVDWEGAFEPAPLGPSSSNIVTMEVLLERFEQFGSSVFSFLSNTLGPGVAASSILLWLYAGPSSHHAQRDVMPRWATSLFAVLRPRHQSSTDWLSDPTMRLALLGSVQTSYFILSLSAHVQQETHRREREEAVARRSVVVTHEYKNIIVPLDTAIFELKGRLAATRVNRGVRNCMEKVCAHALWLERYSLGLHLLAKDRLQPALEFDPDRCTAAVGAAVLYSLALLGSGDADWSVAGSDEAAAMLQQIYGLSSPEELGQSTALALLLVLVGEVTSNMRRHAGTSDERKVHCWINIKGNVVQVWQRAFELGVVKDVHSEGIAFANELIPARFGSVDAIVRVHSASPKAGGHVVERYSQIVVNGRPE